MLKFANKHLHIEVIGFCASALLLVVSCSQSGSQDDGLTASPLADEVLNFSFPSGYNTPGAQLFYSCLFYGYDIRNDSASTRYDTYRISYLAQEDFGYHLVYVKKERINELKETVDSMLSGYGADSSDAYFAMNFYYAYSNDEKIIDGKYLYAARSLYGEGIAENSFVAYSCNLNDISFETERSGETYFLTFAAESKTTTIEENAFAGETIAKSLPLIHRRFLQYDEMAKTFSEYEFTSDEEYLKSYSDEWDALFGFKGEKWETCIANLEENTSCLYMPSRGLLNGSLLGCEALVTELDDCKAIRLPRYEGETDLLSDEASGLSDVYGENKAAFLDAYIEDDVYYSEGSYTWGYYDYDKVSSIVLRS